jgi:hypothetical protein
MPPPWNGRGHIVLPFVTPSFHNHGFRSISLERLDIFNSNLVYGYIIGLCRSSSNLVMVRWFFWQSYPSWKKNSVSDWLFSVLRPAQEYFTYMETLPLSVKGCKI